MLMSASIGLMTGFYKLVKPKATDRQQLFASKIFVVAIILVAFIFTITGGDALAILNIMSYSLITQLVPALLCSFYKNRILNKIGAMAGILTGVGIVFYGAITSHKLIDFFPNIPHVINDISTGMIAVIINFAVAIVVSLATNHLVAAKKDDINTLVEVEA